MRLLVPDSTMMFSCSYGFSISLKKLPLSLRNEKFSHIIYKRWSHMIVERTDIENISRDAIMDY